MQEFTIYFEGGPVQRVQAENVGEAVKYAQKYMPLKRGWTFKVSGKVVKKIQRYNSKGNLLPGYGATVQQSSIVKVGGLRRRPAPVYKPTKSSQVLPKIVDVKVEADELSKGYFNVSPVWGGVDRPIVHSWVVRRRIVDRLVSALRAGVVIENPRIVKDIYDKTYVEGKYNVMGKYMNADLTRLGF